MKRIFEIAQKKPKIYEQSTQNIWNNSYVSKNMLNAHLDENLDSATRKIDFVKKSVEWLANILPPNKYPTLLDLGCGPGIYAELFSHKGYNVSGIDLSERSILFAQNSAKSKQLNIHYAQGDYTKIELNHNYHLIALIYCDFGVLSNKERKKLLLKVYNSLLPNGVFLFDVFTPLKYKSVKETKDWEICKNGFWHEELCLSLHSFYRYDEDNTFLNQYVIATNNDVFFYNVWEHTFTLEELRTDLTETGFKDIEFFGSVIGAPYEISNDTICVLARR